MENGSRMQRQQAEVSLNKRDYFAANVPEAWRKPFWPTTYGGMRDAMIERGIIPSERADHDVLYSYNDKEAQKLFAVMAYEYADVMMECSNESS